MEKSKKQIYIAFGVFALVLLLGGVTYAFFNYTRTGSANVIKTGRIYFNSEQGTAINLTNMFPIDVSNGIPNDNTKVGTVTLNVTGDTTYDEGIEYLVSAVNVQNTVGSGQNAKTLPISIDVSVASNTTNDPATTLGTADDSYFTNRGGNSSIYKVLAEDTISTNEELLVGYITKGATGIDGNIVIKAYLDKAKVAISDTYNGEETDNMGTTTEWVNDRVVFTTQEWNSLQANGVSFQVKVEANEGVWVTDSNASQEEPWNATDASCFTTTEKTIYLYNYNITDNQKNTCESILTGWWGAEEFCSGTNPNYVYDFENDLDNNQLQALEENNIITSISGIEITDYDVNTCGTDVVIPKKINNIDVISTRNDSFYNKGLTSVGIPDTIKCIGDSSFNYNQLTSLTIPGSVIIIDIGAFNHNQLTSLTIPNGVEYIAHFAFANNQIANLSIPSTVRFFGVGDGSYAFEYNPLTNVYIDMININRDTCDYTFYGDTYTGNQIETLTIGPHVQNLESSVFDNNQLTSVTIQGKNSSSDFVSYDGSSWGWADGYSDSNIVWEGSD